jgi:hypothetical protein
MVSRLNLKPEQQRFLSGFIDTYLRLNGEERLQFEAQANRVLNPTEKNKVMELTTSWKEEGRLEERLQLILRLLPRRCGSLPPAVEAQVRGLSGTALEELAEALLEFTGPDDLQRWLRAASGRRG